MRGVDIKHLPDMAEAIIDAHLDDLAANTHAMRDRLGHDWPARAGAAAREQLERLCANGTEVVVAERPVRAARRHRHNIRLAQGTRA